MGKAITGTSYKKTVTLLMDFLFLSSSLPPIRICWVAQRLHVLLRNTRHPLPKNSPSRSTQITAQESTWSDNDKKEVT